LILGWLCSSLTEPLQAQVIGCVTARELWNSLRSIFSATSRARLSELRRQLQTTTKGGLSCTEFVQKMRSIANELAFIGSPVSKEDLILQVLNGLGPDFISFVVAVTTRFKPLHFSKLQAMLLTYESLLLSQTSIGSPSGFYSNPHSYKSLTPFKHSNPPPPQDYFRYGPNNHSYRPRSPFPGPKYSASQHNPFPSHGPLLLTPLGPHRPRMPRPPSSDTMSLMTLTLFLLFCLMMVWLLFI
jgi:gag-polypeptide of LTR copia-type